MTRKTTYFRTRTRLIATAVSACFTASAYGLPSNPTVVNGSASFAQAGNVLNVTNSNGAIINWNTFSIGANETTRFIQPSVSSSILNRVLASDPSIILGTLTSNGRVFLINPNGIYVGQGARIDVAGFVASTLNITNANFLANKLTFDASPNAGSVVNQGSITTPSGGSAYLVAPYVTNEGIITTPQGETILAAGQTVTLLDTATPGVSVEITGAKGNATNLGQIVADAGRIGIAGVLVKNSGALNASSVVNDGGRIFLRATSTVETTATSAIAADGSNGGKVTLVADYAGSFAGTISARGDRQGGFVETSGHRSLSVSGLMVDTRAADGSAGTWLLDPADIVIASGSTTGNSNFAPTGSTSTLYDGDINTSLATTNVSIATSAGSGGSGNITVNGYSDTGGAANINTSSASGPRTLTINADGNLDIHYGASLSGNSTAPLTLALQAGGDITHAGNISSYGPADLLAKGAIVFGDAATNYGYLYTYGAATTLVANWDGNTAIPGVAAVANCAGAGYCGISGRGSIYTNDQYYYYGRPGGDVTIKAAGDIDLTQLSIHANGNEGYYAVSLAGGSGGNVSIGSTQGNLTVGYIDASGGSGGSGTSGNVDLINGGVGGTGGTGGNISLTTPGILALTNDIIANGGSGGSGGNSYYDYSLGAYTGIGGDGGAGSNAGTLSVRGASLALADTTLNFRGGSSGSGSTYGSASGNAGATGSSSPIILATAGDIVISYSNYAHGSRFGLLAGKSIAFGNTTTSYGYLYTYGVPVTMVANWDGISTSAPAVAATGNCSASSLCGISGYGGINTYGNTYYGLASGSLDVEAAGDIDLSQVSIDTSGNSGYSGSSLAWSAGANVTIHSTQGNLTAGYIDASGGYGSSGTSGTSVSPNGGDGGVGGTGGSINLTTPGTLKLTSNIIANGGSGGSGSSGYEYWDSATSAYIYTGTGGNGGAGGNAGTLSVSGASMALADATLDFKGGSGGSGSTYGTTSGNLGAGGSGSPILLATTGDIVISGSSNYAHGSQFELLAGKSITFGNATTSYGYLYTDGISTTLIANWDGISTTAPAVAATGNCTGSSLCGISGSGSLNTNAYYYYYGYGQPGGDLTIKTAGDIDLTQVSINTIGSSGYYATSLAGGAGGNVSIGSSQGNLTVGYINASGGSGGSGVSGTSALPSGGTGGMGGTGGSISFSTPGTLTLTGSISAVGGSGGSGGSTYYDYTNSIYTGTGGNGGVGGMGGNVDVTVPAIAGSYSIDVSGGGGGSAYSGTGSATGGAGGNAGGISLAVTGTLITGNLTARGGSGGYGASGTSIGPNGGTGGAGGAGGSISLTAPGTLTLTDNITANGGSGGSGGGGYEYWDSAASSYVYTGTGGNGGAGGNAGTFSYSGESSLALAGTTLNFLGGAGGAGNTSGTTSGALGAVGTGSPIILSTAGDIVLTGYTYAYGSQLELLAGKSIAFGNTTTSYGYLDIYGIATTMVANWDGVSITTPAVAATGNCTGSSLCGISGNGSIYSNDYYYYYNYSLRGGDVTIKAAGNIDLSQVSIHAYGNSGYYATSLAGGAGGNVSIASTQGNLTVGYIDASGGSGGTGASGTSTSSPNGGPGGSGGTGGSISLATSWILTLTNDITANGGSGGSGGNGYYDYSLATPAYTGTGGNGGAGGNAGTLSANGASLVLAGTTLSFQGGTGGSGSPYAAISGNAGAAGSGSPIILNTVGDIVLTGYNYAYGSQFELLAGKSIAFGNATTSYADLYTNDTPTTLIANWDGNTATPGVASTANCAGASYCGISGSGSIYTNDYYYYESYYGYGQPGGNLTVKAAGDIDLSQVEIDTSGNSGYYTASLAGGAGGNVSIASTQGNLTMGYVDASGGYGGSGTSGTSTSLNGGTGGAGGTGGSISLSTPGTLTLNGSLYANGGSGGYGGSGYYDYSLATPAYTGAGGNGGSGGIGGGITASASSISASTSYLSVAGGGGGTAGSGLTSGIGAISGTGGAMSLASTAGNIAVDAIDAGTVRIVSAGSISLKGTVSSDASGDAVVLAGNGFSDNGGFGVISAPNGRWLVYSTDPTLDDYSGLAYDFKQYNAPYSASTTVLGSGNGLLYSLNPSLTVTLTNPGATTKTYDGTVSAPQGFAPTAFTVSGFVGSDSGPLVLGTAVYNDAHVTLANSLTVGLSLGAVTDGNSKPVYGYPTSFSTSVGASITPLELSASAPVIGGTTTKVYDGAVSATGAAVSGGNITGAISGDVLALDASGLILNYNSAHVGSATSIDATGSLGFAISSSTAGSLLSDYGFTSPAISSVAGNITAKALTSTANIGGTTTKIYDGTTAATGATLSGTVNGAISGDALTFDGSGLTLAYNSAHVASATSIGATGSAGFSIGSSGVGSQVTDYSFTGPVLGSVAGSIMAKGVTATAVIGGTTTKVYDGTVAAPGAMVSGSVTGAVNGDVLALDTSGLVLTYNSAHVASTTSIGATGSIGLTISSSGAGSQMTDYSFTTPNPSSVAGSITAKVLTASLTNTGVTKPYDGTTAASFTPTYSISGLISGDTAASFTTTSKAYNDAHVANASYVTVSGVGLSGITSGLASPSLPSDYSLGTVTSLNSAAGSASITPAVLAVSGDWSTPTSWIGNLLPQNTDLLGVLIPDGTTVTFDGIGGPTSVPYLTSAGKFSMTSGTLSVAGTLDTVDYAQSGGALTAANVNINSAGAISQTGGSLTTPILTTVSVEGTTLNGANAIGSIQASNSGSGGIALSNTGALSIAGITNSAGNINISNAGPMSMNESQVYTSTGTVTLAVLNGGSLTLDNGSLIEGNQGVFIGSSGVSLDHASTIQTGPVATANVEMVISEGDITLANGSTINAGHDVILTLTGPNAQVVLNAVPGQLASAINTESASSTHINFLSRTSGGIVIDGAPTTTTVAGDCGFYAKGNPATLGNGLEIVYPGSNATDDSAAAPVAQVIDQYFAEVTQTASSSESTEVTEKTGTTSEDDKKKKKDDTGNNEGKDNNEHHNGKTGQCT